MSKIIHRIFAIVMSVITFFTGGIFGIKKGIDDIKEPTFYVEDVKIDKGESSATVKVHIVKNPGIAGAKITISFDEQLTLKKAESGNAFSPLQYTKPGRLSNPCSFTWDSESGMVKDDGVILELTFEIPSNVYKGNKFFVDCSYKNGDIYDENLNDVSLSVINGYIYIK